MLTASMTLTLSSPSISIILFIINLIIVILVKIVTIFNQIAMLPRFTPELFFYYLLPPIILEAAYCLHNKHFFDNIRAILWSLDAEDDSDGDGDGVLRLTGNANMIVIPQAAPLNLNNRCHDPGQYLFQDTLACQDDHVF